MDDRDYLKVSTHYDSVTDVWRYVMGTTCITAILSLKTLD